MSFTMNTAVIGTGAKVRDLIFNPVSGYTRAEYDVLVRRIGYTDDGDESDERTEWSLTGATDANTATEDGGQVLYVSITGSTDAVVTLYSDSARSASVAAGTESTRSTGSEVTLSATNGSGLTGVVTLADASTNDIFTLTIEDYHDRYDHDVDNALDNIIGIDNGLLMDGTSPVKDIVGLVYEADGAKLDELGFDNVVGAFQRRTLIDNLKLKNITII